MLTNRNGVAFCQVVRISSFVHPFRATVRATSLLQLLICLQREGANFYQRVSTLANEGPLRHATRVIRFPHRPVIRGTVLGAGVGRLRLLPKGLHGEWTTVLQASCPLAVRRYTTKVVVVSFRVVMEKVPKDVFVTRCSMKRFWLRI